MKRVFVSIVTFLLFTIILINDGFAADQKLPDVQVHMYKGKPTVFINEKPNALAAYCPYYIESFYEKYMPVIFELGYDLYFIDPRSLPQDYHTTRFWVGVKIDSKPVVEVAENHFSLDKQAEILLKNDPDAYLMVRFTHHPPTSWRKLHPSEFFINEEGQVQNSPSFASDVFWEAASRYCAAIVRYCESRPWANHVIGYVNFQLTEGTMMTMLDGWLYDHNPAMLMRWREFLKKKYGTNEKLREAYGDTALTFETVQVPKDKLRGSLRDVSGSLYWQNAKDNQPLRDYLELTQYFWHLRFSQICKAMHDGADRNVLIMHDALKQPMQGWNHNGFFAIGRWKNTSWNYAWSDILAGSGHIGVASLFNNTPGFSGLLTPHDYQARGIGGVYEPEGITESTVMRGMYFFDEMDTRVSPVNSPDGSKGIGSARNERELAAIGWRNFAVSFTRAFNSYWHHAWTMGDWIFSKGAQDIMKRQAEVVRESLNWEHETMPGIAFVLDDSAVLETNGSGHYFNEAVMWEYKMGVARCGVPFRIYLFEDLMLDNFPKHHVFYFPNLFRIDDERLNILKKKVFRDGNVVIWGPGSGISDGTTIGTASASKLTGFEFEMIPANSPRRILISDFDHPITKGLDAAVFFGGALPYGPVLLPADGKELGVAWVKGGQSHTGLAVKEFGKGAAGIYEGSEPLGEGDYASVFTAAVSIPANIWRNIASYAGAHIYCDTNDLIFVDKSIVALNSLQSGRKTIKLPGTFRVRNVISGEVYSDSTDKIVFEHESPDTHIYLLER